MRSFAFHLLALTFNASCHFNLGVLQFIVVVFILHYLQDRQSTPFECTNFSMTIERDNNLLLQLMEISYSSADFNRLSLFSNMKQKTASSPESVTSVSDSFPVMFLRAINLHMQSLWYLASAPIRYRDPSSWSVTWLAHSSLRALHLSSRNSLYDFLSCSEYLKRHKKAYLHLSGFFASFSMSQISSQ